MIDAVVKYMPSPIDIPPVKGTDPETGEEIERKASDEEPMSTLAFKIATDPFIGKLAFVRVYSGILKNGTYVFNSSKGIDVGGDGLGLGDLLRLQPLALEHVLEVHVAAHVELVGAVEHDAAVLEQLGQHAVGDGGTDLALYVV